ncbi:MAG TPA: A/G-specific adenine glycosylase [Bacteroidia bacterium]|nr:A/G-specific adenine glycosylase [Bacteroidia bacterium]
MPQSHPISDILITWYKKNKRDLPWRNTKDPYKIWLSEIILQQTQVVQGLNYYIKFVENFPTVIDLAEAPEDKIMRLWQGLGYYSRARNLHAAAKAIKLNHKGVFPKTYESIKELKGVGDYTAAAVSSFAYNLPHAVVDGNVYRVLARLFNVDTAINSTQGKKEFQLLADEILNKKQAGLHNSAMMEFGALWCKPQNPKCEECPLQSQCLAFEKNTVSSLPVKDKKIKIKNRYLHYFVFNYKDSVYIQKRTAKDIWQNLYQFFLIETGTPTEATTILKDKQLKKLVKEIEVISITPVKKHILSHQHLHAVFYEVKIKAPITSKSLLKIKRDKLIDYALPQLINKYLKSSV